MILRNKAMGMMNRLHGRGLALPAQSSASLYRQWLVDGLKICQPSTTATRLAALKSTPRNCVGLRLATSRLTRPSVIISSNAA